MQSTMHAYEVRPRKDNGVDLISDVLPFGGLWYYGPDAVAKALCASGRIVGANYTIYDPERDPEGRCASPLIRCIADGVRERSRATECR